MKLDEAKQILEDEGYIVEAGQAKTDDAFRAAIVKKKGGAKTDAHFQEAMAIKKSIKRLTNATSIDELCAALKDAQNQAGDLSMIMKNVKFDIVKTDQGDWVLYIDGVADNGPRAKWGNSWSN